MKVLNNRYVEYSNGRKVKMSDYIISLINLNATKRLNELGVNQKRLSSSLTKKIKKSLGNYCRNCGGYFPQEVLELDHIKPFAFSLDNSKRNFQNLCPNCHKVKTIADRIYFKK